MPATVKSYFLVAKSTLDDLAEAICQKIPKGWQPFGSLSVTTSGDDSEELFVLTLVLLDDGSLQAEQAPTVKSYCFVAKNNPDDLTKAVCKKITEGWQPYSSLSVTTNGDDLEELFVLPIVLLDNGHCKQNKLLQ